MCVAVIQVKCDRYLFAETLRCWLQTRIPIQYLTRCILIRSQEPQDLCSECDNHFGIWQVSHHHCCRYICQISKGYKHPLSISCDWEAWYFMQRCLVMYWLIFRMLEPDSQLKVWLNVYKLVSVLFSFSSWHQHENIFLVAHTLHWNVSL